MQRLTQLCSSSILQNECTIYISHRGFAQLKKTRKTLTPEEVRAAQIQKDQSGLLQLAMKAEEAFYEAEGSIDLEQIQKEEEQIAKDLDTQHEREQDVMDEITSTYNPLATTYNPILDYDAHAGHNRILYVSCIPNMKFLEINNI